jgi:hypothetical protein
MSYRSVLLVAACLAAVPARALAAPWTAWEPLVGEWIGEGEGKPGAGTGGFTFELEVQGRVLVRRNRAEYPAAQGRPAFRHDDLMVLWNAPDGTRASYWDSEGHVIDYRCNAAPRAWTCETRDVSPGFRLEYTLVDPGRLKIQFAISQTGKPQDLKTYIIATAQRKRP